MRNELSSTTCNFAEPREGEIMYAMTNTLGETEGNAFSDALGKLDVLPDSIEKGVVCRLGHDLGGIREDSTKDKSTWHRVTRIN